MVKYAGSRLAKKCEKGCILSPYLFRLFREYILREAGPKEDEHGFKSGGRNTNNLCYPDDTNPIGENTKDLEALVLKIKENRKKIRLK